MTLKIKQKCSGKHASHWPCLILWHLALICSTALNHTRLQHPNSTISYWILKPVRGLAYHKNNDTELTFLIRDLESKSYGIKQGQWYLNSMNNGIFASQGFLIRTAFFRSGADQKPLASEDGIMEGNVWLIGWLHFILLTSHSNSSFKLRCHHWRWMAAKFGP